MKELLCATGNKEKLGIANQIVISYGVHLRQALVAIDEIQGEDPVAIVTDKARRAYAALGQPVVVTDDSWSIPSLGGFPGPYMKSVNHWFAPQDFLDLMASKTDRSITLHQYVAYIDATRVKLFSGNITGIITTEPRGTFGDPLMKVVALDHDNGLTISEVYDQGGQHNAERLADANDVWGQLGAWLRQHADSTARKPSMTA